jgi:hypothetical protein
MMAHPSTPNGAIFIGDHIDSYMSISIMPANDAIHTHFSIDCCRVNIFSLVELTIVQDGREGLEKKRFRPRDRPSRAAGVYFR